MEINNFRVNEFFTSIIICIYFSFFFINSFLFLILILFLGIGVIIWKKYVIEFNFIFSPLVVVTCSLISMSIEKKADYLNYIDIINGVITSGVDYSTRDGEFGFQFIVFIMSHLTTDVNFIYFIIVLITNSFLILSLIKLDRNLGVLVYILLQINYLFVITPFLLRQMLSVSIILFLISIYNQCKYILFPIPLFIHFSSIVSFIFISLSNKFHFSKKFFYFMISSSCILFFVLNQSMLQFIFNLGYTPKFLELKAAFYFNKFDNFKLDYIAMFLSLLAIYIKWNSLNFIDNLKGKKILIDILFLNACLFIATANIPILPTRLGFIFYYMSPLLLLVLGKFKWCTFPSLVKLTTIFILIFLSCYRVYLNDFSKPWIVISDGNIITTNILKYIYML